MLVALSDESNFVLFTKIQVRVLLEFANPHVRRTAAKGQGISSK